MYALRKMDYQAFKMFGDWLDSQKVPTFLGIFLLPFLGGENFRFGRLGPGNSKAFKPHPGCGGNFPRKNHNSLLWPTQPFWGSNCGHGWMNHLGHDNDDRNFQQPQTWKIHQLQPAMIFFCISDFPNFQKHISLLPTKIQALTFWDTPTILWRSVSQDP